MSADLRLERHVDRTPEACFDLWTRAEALAQWWGPKDDKGRPFQADVEAWTAAPGEPWAIALTAPDGSRFDQTGKMLEVVRPRLIRFSFAWVQSGETGPETEIRVTFEPVGTGTRLIFEQTGFTDAVTRDAHVEGWEECLDRHTAQALLKVVEQ